MPGATGAVEPGPRLEHSGTLVANYLSVKAGFYSEADARRQRYSSFEDALYDAIFDSYESFARIDDFLPYALSHVQADKKDSCFRYVRGEPPTK